jgi:hypothetical protein
MDRPQHATRNMKTIFFLPPIFLLLLVLPACSTLRVPRTGVDVHFPTVATATTNKPPLKLPPVDPAKLKSLTVDGATGYYSESQASQPAEESVFDKIVPGMDFQQLVALLGPGFRSIAQDCSIIHWNCEDGRELHFWPDVTVDGKSHYWIDARGQDQRHEIVGRLAQDLIAGILIKDAKAVIVCTKNTCQAKAGKPRTYRVGDRLQKAEPLPRIDLTFKRINADGLLCDYWYQACPEGIIHYFEHGTIAIRPKDSKPLDGTSR